MSTNWLAHTLLEDAGRCSMQGSSTEHTGSQLHSTDQLISFKIIQRTSTDGVFVCIAGLIGD